MDLSLSNDLSKKLNLSESAEYTTATTSTSDALSLDPLRTDSTDAPDETASEHDPLNQQQHPHQLHDGHLRGCEAGLGEEGEEREEHKCQEECGYCAEELIDDGKFVF